MAKTPKSSNLNGVRQAPDPMLLALVAQFLANNGFNSSHRIYNTERKKRPKKEGWQGTFAKDYTAKFPPLEAIFKSWQEQSSRQDTNASSSEDQASGSDSDSSSESELEIHSKPKPISSSASASSKSDSSSAESDSESSSESEAIDSPPKITKKVQPDTSLSRAANQTSHLKRKAPTSSSASASSSTDDSGSASDTDNEVEKNNRPAKKPKIQPAPSNALESETSSDSDLEESSESETLQTAAKTKLPSSDEDSSDASSSDSDVSVSSTVQQTVPKTGTLPDQAQSDSSATVTGDTQHGQVPRANVGKAASETVQNATKRKHIGAQPTRLAQLSVGVNTEDYLSNNYVSYAYADRAYADLSVTRGKGFTKEKNKKKRGSYRGGAIDINGGKGFKFED